VTVAKDFPVGIDESRIHNVDYMVKNDEILPYSPRKVSRKGRGWSRQQTAFGFERPENIDDANLISYVRVVSSTLATEHPCLGQFTPHPPAKPQQQYDLNPFVQSL